MSSKIIYIYTCNIHKIARNLFFFFFLKKKPRHFSCHDLKRIVSIIHNKKYGFKNCNCQGKALYFWILLNVISGFFFRRRPIAFRAMCVCMYDFHLVANQGMNVLRGQTNTSLNEWSRIHIAEDKAVAQNRDTTSVALFIKASIQTESRAKVDIYDTDHLI